MKRHWRHVILLTTVILLTMLVVGLGAAVWVYKSGRLATLAHDLLQRFSGQNVTIEMVTFASWHTVVFTNVHLQQRFPGWQLRLECPRLEAHYSLLGLFKKQIDHLYLYQPRAELVRSDHAAPSQRPPFSSDTVPIAAFPLKRVTMRQGNVQIRWGKQQVTVLQLEATLRHRGARQLQIDMRGGLAGSNATFHASGHTQGGDPSQLGSLRLRLNAIPLPLLGQVLPQLLPPTWQITQGTLQVETELTFHVPTVSGTLTTTIKQVTGRSENMAMQQATLSTEAHLEANPGQQTLQLQGQAHLQAAQIRYAPDTTITDLSLTTPWRLTYAPGQWQVTATPRLQSRTATLGTLLQASHPSLRMPMQARRTRRGLQIQATPAITVPALHLWPGGRGRATELQINGLHAHLPLRGDATHLESDAARLQTQTWQLSTNTTPYLATLTLLGSGAVDLRRQRLTLRDLTATVPQLGRLQGHGAWHWSSHTLQDLQLQLTPESGEAIWATLQRFLPESYHAWQVGGHTRLQLRVAQASLRPPRRLQSLVITWQVRHAAFSSPDSTYAGEHLTGTLQATATLDASAGRTALQGTLTLQPPALLIGSLFPAFEAHKVTSTVTFSAIYDMPTARLQLYLAGQFRHLGLLTLQGMISRPFEAPRYELQINVRHLHAARLWKVLVSDPVRFPTLSQAEVEGRLNATIRLHGHPTHFFLRGTLDVTGGYFGSGPVVAHGVSLLLPLQGRYPLPKQVPERATLPPEAYGSLRIDALQIGGVELGRVTARLALRSDNFFVQRGIYVSLGGGRLALERLTAHHLLQPSRRLAFRLRLHNLNLQQLPRHLTTLPLAGVINGDFPLLQIDGNRLQTQGSLTIAIAGGVLRLSNLQGSNLLTGLPTLRCSLATERPLSLLRLTSLYPIGDIGGSLHLTVTNLTLTAGELAAFSLTFAVQDKGGERREITLRALNNLLFSTGSTKVAAGVLGETQRLSYKRFGATITLRHDTLQLRGTYHDQEGREYFMQAPALGGGVSIINRVPENGIPFREFLRRLKATVIQRPHVQTK